MYFSYKYLFIFLFCLPLSHFGVSSSNIIANNDSMKWLEKDIIDINTTSRWNSSYISTYVLLTRTAYDPIPSPFQHFHCLLSQGIFIPLRLLMWIKRNKSCSKEYIFVKNLYKYIILLVLVCTLLLYVYLLYNFLILLSTFLPFHRRWRKKKNQPTFLFLL